MYLIIDKDTDKILKKTESKLEAEHVFNYFIKCSLDVYVMEASFTNLKKDK